MPSPLPHLPRNPLGDAPRNPLGRPPAIGSRSGGGGGGRRYRLRSPLPRGVGQRPPQQQRQPAQIIRIQDRRPTRTEAPQAAPPPSPAPSAAQQRRETLHGLLREPDRDYVSRMPAEHQEHFRVALREHGHELARGHSRAGLQYLDDVRRRQRGLPTREVPPRARVRVNSKRVRQAVARKVKEAADEQPREPTPEQRAKRHQQLQSMRQIADQMRPDTPEGEQ